MRMSLLLNVLWLIFGGGLFLGLGWLLAGVVFAVSIVGLPWARAAFNLASLSFLPFGRTTVPRNILNGGRDDLGTGPFGVIGNIVWFVLAGWWLALGHVVIGVVDCVTIIGIPFGVANFRLASAALLPIGLAVVPKEVAEEARRRDAARVLDRRATRP
jgi:uncharacterized membrane protein YccF (DUF307 family)